MKRAILYLLSLIMLIPLPSCDGGFSAGMDFTYALPQNIDSLDPQTAGRLSSYVVIGSIFEGLCRIDGKGDTVPGVAERWTHNENYTQFVFHLNRSAKWSNGQPVVADDFIFAIQRALMPETATPSVDDLFVIQGARGIYNGQTDPSFLGMMAQDQHTLVINLERSYPDFPALTAGAHYMPCNKEYFEGCSGHYGLSAEYLITNGPFTFTSIYAWDATMGSRKVILEPDANYHRAKSVAPSTLTFLIDYPDSITTDPVSALTQGTIDMASLSENAAREAEENGCSIQLIEDSVTGLLLNPEEGDEILKELSAREILIRSIDRQNVLDRRIDTGSSEAMGIMPVCVRWAGESYYSDGAAMFAASSPVDDLLPQLLKTLDVSKMPSITVICPNDEESINIANGLIISWNDKLGNSFNIEPLEDAEFQQRIASGQYQAALYTLRAGGTNPYQVFKAFESSSSPVLMKDPEFDSRLHSVSFELSSYRDLETYLRDKFIFYPLFNDKSYYASNPKCQGIVASPDLLVDFTGAKKRD